MRDKKRIILLLVLCMMAAVLVAWKLKPVELIDEKILIDLDATVQDADYGQEDSGADDSDVPDFKEDDGTPDIAPTVSPETMEEITIVIRGEKTKINDVTMHNLSTVEKFLDMKCSEDTRVYLMDDYAEAHVYKSVQELLQKKQSEIPFVISEVMAEG